MSMDRGEMLALLEPLYDKLKNSPLGMSTAWERKASGGKPLLYGGKRGLLAYGTIATWDEFDFIVAVANAMPDILATLRASAAPSDGVEAERMRCIAICEGWIGTFQDKEIKYTTPREYAVDAIEDIIDLIRDGRTPAISSAQSKDAAR